MYGSWDMERNRQNFLSFWNAFFANPSPPPTSTPTLPTPPIDPKNQNFEIIKNTPGDIIILHMCIINDNHMMYGSWDMKRDGQNFLSFWTVFCPFTPLTTQKIKTLKN